MTKTKAITKNKAITRNKEVTRIKEITRNKEITENKETTKNKGKHEQSAYKQKGTTTTTKEITTKNKGNPKQTISKDSCIETQNRYSILNENPGSESCNTNNRVLKSILKNTSSDEQKDWNQGKRVRFKIPSKGRKNKGNKKGKIDKLRIMYVNINGIKDKLLSLEANAEAYEAHIVAVTETKQLPPKLKGYGNWKSKERTGKGGGGVAIAARLDISSKIMTSTQGLGMVLGFILAKSNFEI